MKRAVMCWLLRVCIVCVQPIPDRAWRGECFWCWVRGIMRRAGWVEVKS